MFHDGVAPGQLGSTNGDGGANSESCVPHVNVQRLPGIPGGFGLCDSHRATLDCFACCIDRSFPLSNGFYGELQMAHAFIAEVCVAFAFDL